MTATFERLAFSGLLAVGQITIGAYVFIRGRPRAVTRAYGAFVAFLVAWTISIGIAHAPTLTRPVIVRATFAAAALLIPSLLLFVAMFPRSPVPKSQPFRIFLLLGCALASLSFSGLIVKDSAYSPMGLEVQYGSLHPIFAAYVILGLVIMIALLVRRLHSTQGRERLQMRYLLVAFLVPAAGISMTNLVMPLVFRVSAWGRYGPAFTLILLALTGHTMIRQGLMDMRVAIGQTVSRVAAIGIAVGLFLPAVWFSINHSNDTEFGISGHIAAIFILALVFRPVAERIRILLDRYCYRQAYDYGHVIRRSSRAFSSTFDLAQLLRHMFDLLNDTVQPETVAVYLYQEDLAAYQLLGRDPTTTDPPFPISIEARSPVVRALSARQRLILADGSLDTEEVPDAVGALQGLGVECACPIKHEGHLFAFLLLGSKRSGDPYYADDIELLSTIAEQASAAIKNAELYRIIRLLDTQRRQAERLAEAGSLSAGIAHEIRNPLVAIRTFAELLPERYGDEEFRDQFGKVMVSEIERIKTLVDRLRGTENRSDEALQVLDITLPIEETLVLMGPRLERSGIRIRKAYVQGKVFVRGRPDELKQLFLNLTINALEAMGGGGEIGVKVERREALGARIVEVSVEDTGPGIAEEVSQALFHPFVSTKQGSSGLGLWMCRRIADAHNATIRGLSREGEKGSQFVVEFPAVES